MTGIWLFVNILQLYSKTLRKQKQNNFTGFVVLVDWFTVIIENVDYL